MSRLDIHKCFLV